MLASLHSAFQSPHPLCHAPLCPSDDVQREVEWVDSYHRRVWEALSPRLEGQQAELEWLKLATSPLSPA